MEAGVIPLGGWDAGGPRQDPGPSPRSRTRDDPWALVLQSSSPCEAARAEEAAGWGCCGGLGLSRGRGILAGVLLRGARGPSRGLREGFSGLGTASELPSEWSEQEAQGTAWGALGQGHSHLEIPSSHSWKLLSPEGPTCHLPSSERWAPDMGQGTVLSVELCARVCLSAWLFEYVYDVRVDECEWELGCVFRNI